MAKVKPEVWAKAKALREAGKSFREIEKLLNIPFMTISDRAKKEEWEAGKTVQLIKDTIRVEKEIRTLETVQQNVVRDEVARKLEGMEFYASHVRKVVKMGIVSLSKDATPLGMKNVVEGMKGAMQIEGIVPFYPNAVVLNNSNTNTQQIGGITRTYVDAQGYTDQDGKDIQAVS